MTYDGSNRLTSRSGTPLSYDANGNLTAFGLATYTWDVRSQLVTTNTGAGSFSYDALRRRVSATVNGTTTTYLQDGLNPAAISGNVMLAGMGLDEVYGQITPGGATSYLRDGVNSTVAEADATGAVTGNYAYSPYGGTANSGNGTTRLQFTGRDNDGAAGLYYYRARYYSPQLTRFISEDPIGLAGGTNFYAYANGNPISFIDPSGLAPISWKTLREIAILLWYLHVNKSPPPPPRRPTPVRQCPSGPDLVPGPDPDPDPDPVPPLPDPGEKEPLPNIDDPEPPKMQSPSDISGPTLSITQILEYILAF
jgi:RHS repeat-associated protein